MEQTGSNHTHEQAIYSQQASDRVDSYRQQVNSIYSDTGLTEDERENLLIEAGQWYETHVLSAGFTEQELTWAWFANSSEDEWAEPVWDRAK